MSMLARYKRPGGFLQLLSLIESFGPQKREKFMEMIQAEDPVWAQAIHSKLLTIERILDWPEQVLSDIFKMLPTKNLACMIKGISPENVTKIVKFLSHAEKRKLDDELGTMEAKPEEIFTSFVRTIDLTRRMIKEGQIRLDKFDPDLAIMDGYEDYLSHQTADAAPALSFEMKKKMDVGELDSKVAMEMMAMQNSLNSVVKENKTLKDELKVLREKLEQIRKIA